MNDTFSTNDFDTLCSFIKSLLSEEYEVRIIVDCEGVYMVDYCKPNYSCKRFELFDEEEMTLDGDKIQFVDS